MPEGDIDDEGPDLAPAINPPRVQRRVFTLTEYLRAQPFARSSVSLGGGESGPHRFGFPETGGRQQFVKQCPAKTCRRVDDSNGGISSLHVTNDWQPGYIPPASAFGYGIYQEIIAATSPGCHEMLIEAICRHVAAWDTVKS